jgi:pimeloyl-ACP methyl ester carboxylesterase
MFVVLDEGRPSSKMEFFRDRARMVTEISRDYWIESQESMGKLRLSDAMTKCQVPTLIVAGATDTLLLANVHDVYRMPDAVLHVSGISGHETALHDPEGVALAIDNFMKGKMISAKKFRQGVNRKLKQRGHLPIPPRPKM